MTVAYRHDEIAKLAYELWERRGRPLGSPEIDWHAAESTLGVRDSQGQFSLPVSALSRKKVPIANPECSVAGHFYIDDSKPWPQRTESFV